MSLPERELRESLVSFHKAFAELKAIGDDRGRRESVLRLAQALTQLGGTRGFHEIEHAARELVEADARSFEDLFERLWIRLQAAVRAVPHNAVRVLIVESDGPHAQQLRAAFESAHREIVIAESVVEAEEVIGRRRFGIIVMAHELEEGDTREFLLQLRRKGRTKTTPVFVVGSAEPAVVLETMALGATRWFDKPVEPVELAAALNFTLRDQQASESRVHLDPLTGLKNVDGFSMAYDRLASFCKREGSHLTLALIEVADLRALNDREGDEGGDICLLQLAKVLRQTLRQSDLTARWGGRTFVLLLPNTTLEGAQVALRKIRQRLTESPANMPSGASVSTDIRAAIIDAVDCPTAVEAVASAEGVIDEARRIGPGAIVTGDELIASEGKTVLLAESDADSATSVKQWLAMDGFDVRHVTDGDQVLHEAQQLDVALFLLDVSLPGCDAFEMLTELRQSHRYARTPVAIIGSFGNDGDVVRGLELGADDFLTRPFTESDVRERLHRVLAKRGISLPAPTTATTR